MTKFVLAIAATMALSGVALAATYTLDANGKCKDDHGKFSKQAFCAAAHTYTLDPKGKCHDETGKFAAAKLCHA